MILLDTIVVSGVYKGSAGSIVCLRHLAEGAPNVVDFEISGIEAINSFEVGLGSAERSGAGKAAVEHAKMDAG